MRIQAIGTGHLFSQLTPLHLILQGAAGALNGASQGLITPFYPLTFEVYFRFFVAQVGYLMMLGGLATGLIDRLSS